MFIHRRKPHDPVGGSETPEEVFYNRRKWLRLSGWGLAAGIMAGGGYLGWRRLRGSDEEVIQRGAVQLSDQQSDSLFPARRDDRFKYGRPETDRFAAARYTNFYEFSRLKSSWRYVGGFQTNPWTVTIDGLCRNQFSLDIDEFHHRYASDLVERQYRHRCVETWAMAVPWTGIPLARLLADADPLPQATHVRFVSFLRPEQAPHQEVKRYPWPYTEGLTLAEASNELTLLTTGVYGRPLIKQHGAPIRLVVPWKYGFKSIKSIERIELVDREPTTFWNTLNPEAYPFQSNVEPQVPRPWPQHEEWMLGTKEVFPTQLYNGYEQYVAHLYAT